MMDIISFIFARIKDMFAAIQTFEPFPGVPFGTLMICFGILSVIFSLIFNQFYDDLMGQQWFFKSSEKDRQDYMPKHSEAYVTHKREVREKGRFRLERIRAKKAQRE